MNVMLFIVVAWAYNYYLLIQCYGLVEDNSFLRVGERGFVLANIIGFGSYSNVKLENDTSKSNASMKITCFRLIYQK